MKTYSAEEISGLVSGKIVGNREVRVSSASGIEDAVEGQITFLGNKKYEPHIYKSKASIIIVDSSIELLKEIDPTVILVDNAHMALSTLLEELGKRDDINYEVSAHASIGPGVRFQGKSHIGDFTVIKQGVNIGDECVIHPQVYIGEGVIIGARTTIYPGVKIYRECVLGQDCIIHSNLRNFLVMAT